MSNYHQSHTNSPSPAVHAVSVTVGTPYGTATNAARALYIGGAGAATLVLPNGSEIAFVGLLAGTILPVYSTNVKAGATATNIVALF
jgi:hypothetical protein